MLLLRSTKSSERPTQIDVLFKNVAAIQLPTAFDDLEIREFSQPDEFPAPQLGIYGLSDRKMYRVVGAGVQGYVVAGAVAYDESDREYGDQSPLIPRTG